MKTKDYLEYLTNTIHSTVVATVDEDGLPVTCAIDIMDCDDDSLYFLTAKGKKFYDRLKRNGNIALTGMKGESTMSCVAVSLRGKVCEIGPELLPRLFEKNPYMNDIYPGEAAKKALTVFQIYEGNGEWFNLSVLPIERATFSFGGSENKAEGYFVTEACIGCKKCEELCPMKCIDTEKKPAEIKQENCVHCGNCLEVCPVKAVIKK